MKSSLRPEAKPFQPAGSVSLDSQGLNQVISMSPEEPIESSAPPPELLSMGSVQADKDDPEIRAALVVEPEQITAPPSRIEKDSIEDYSFCSICACPVTDSSEDPSSIPESAENLYHKHCCTYEHRTNEKLKEQFDSEVKDYYFPKKDDLLKLLSKCRALYKFQRHQKLQHIVDATKKDIEEMGTFILSIQESAEWKKGVDTLQNDYSGKLQFKDITLRRLIKETEEVKQKIEREEKQQEEKTEEEYKEDEHPDSDVDIAMTHIDYGERGKKKSRKSKKERRSKK